MKTAPLALKVVAGLFLVTGVWSVIQVLVSLEHGDLLFDLGILGLLIAPGLLRFSRGWRKCAIVLLGVELVLYGLFALLILTYPDSLEFGVLGRAQGHAPWELALAMTLALFSLSLWQIRVLIRPAVRELFAEEDG